METLELPAPTTPDFGHGIVDGDAATHLEALVFDGLLSQPLAPSADGLPIELVGQHLRLSGSVQIGFHRRRMSTSAPIPPITGSACR